jgi:hypothetical protein
MAQRRQRGWLKKENRIQGETWVLHFRKTRKSDGKRVENKVPIGLLRDLPDKLQNKDMQSFETCESQNVLLLFWLQARVFAYRSA